jgi:hypothetical protein
MAARKKNVDPFSSLRPRTLDVPVGDHILTLKTSTLDQETRMLEAISELDLGSVFQPIGEMLSLNADGDGDDSSALDLIPKVAKLGPEIWGAVRQVLGKQFVPTMRLISTALLDTPTNMRLLIGNEAIPASSKEDRTDDGAWLGCDSVHRFIQDEITLVQSTHLLKSAFELNGYTSALGNLLPLMSGGENQETKVA